MVLSLLQGYCGRCIVGLSIEILNDDLRAFSDKFHRTRKAHTARATGNDGRCSRLPNLLGAP